MTPSEAKRPAPGGAFRFKVSDSAAVPLRGHMLRLKVVEGNPSMKDLKPGRALTVTSPSGETRQIGIVGHSATAGRARQDRLDQLRELDIIISSDDASKSGRRIAIGWSVSGPV
jgi:hypothetical protein